MIVVEGMNKLSNPFWLNASAKVVVNPITPAIIRALLVDSVWEIKNAIESPNAVTRNANEPIIVLVQPKILYFPNRNCFPTSAAVGSDMDNIRIGKKKYICGPLCQLST